MTQPARRPDVTMVAAVLAAAMAVSVFPSLALGVLAGFLIEDLAVGRTEVGIAVAAVSAVSAASSLLAGRLTDSRGGRTALLVVFGLGAIAILGLAASPAYPILLLFTLIAGFCSGGSNPATNKVVVEALEPGRRGLVTGVKQSGEMMAVVACGIVLPIAAVAVGWRIALGAAAVVPILAFIAVRRLIPSRPVVRNGSPQVRTGPLAPGVVWIAVYALFMGIAGNAVITYLPLYAQESLGLPVTIAGLVVAVTGSVAIAGRIAWAQLAERSGNFNCVLAVNAGLAIASASALWLAGRLDSPPLLWLGAAGWGGSLLSFGAVAMLAVMAMSGPTSAGRASGVVLTGFGFGLMLGPPMFGLLADSTGTYDAGLAVVLAALAAAVLTTAAWRFDDRRRTMQDASAA